MAHKHRILDTDPIVVPITPDADGKAQSDIPKGYLVALDDGTEGLLKVTDWAWDTDLATTRAAFVAAFVGVSEDRVRAGYPATFSDDPNIELNPSVMTKGEFDVEVADATYAIGDLLGPDDSGASSLLNTCEKVTGVTEACFRVVEAKTTSATNGQTIRARLISDFSA